VITHLGVQDDGASGPNPPNGFVTSPINVGLWNATGTTLLANTGVLSTDPLNDSYRYHALTSPVVLSANTQYLIGAAVGSGLEFFEDSGAAVSPPFTGLEVAMIQNRFNGPNGTLQPPLSDGTLTVGRWAPANALAVALPEPGTIVIWGLLGAVGLAISCRVCRKR
jgi:hypothetical protein